MFFFRGRILEFYFKLGFCEESLINNENWKNAYTQGYVLNIIRGEPERAPNTRETESGFIICICIYILVCLWGDHFSEERVKF